MLYETMFNFDLSTPENEKDIESLGLRVSLGIVPTVKRLLFLLMLSKPKEYVFHILVATETKEIIVETWANITHIW